VHAAERGFIHVDACLSAIPFMNSSALFPVKNDKIKHQFILAARCCWFQGRHIGQIHCFNCSDCALLCEVSKTNSGKCLLANLLKIRIIFAFNHNLTVLARQVLVQSSFSSRACSKRVMNQTKFDVPDPLVVHVLLLTHK